MRNFEKQNPSLAKTQSQGPIQQPEPFGKLKAFGALAIPVHLLGLFLANFVFCSKTMHSFFVSSAMFSAVGYIFFSIVACCMFFAQRNTKYKYWYEKYQKYPHQNNSPSSSSFTHDPFERNHIPDTDWYSNPCHPFHRYNSNNPSSPSYNDPHQ